MMFFSRFEGRGLMKYSKRAGEKKNIDRKPKRRKIEKRNKEFFMLSAKADMFKHTMFIHDEAVAA